MRYTINGPSSLRGIYDVEAAMAIIAVSLVRNFQNDPERLAEVFDTLTALHPTIEGEMGSRPRQRDGNGSRSGQSAVPMKPVAIEEAAIARF
jgi:hypothetical protein